MESYFNVIPSDILHVILLKLYNPTDYSKLYDISPYNKVLNNPQFWNKNHINVNLCP